MPSASAKQHRFMEAVAHNPAFAKKVGISQSVGKDFSAADKGRTFNKGDAIMMKKGGMPPAAMAAMMARRPRMGASMPPSAPPVMPPQPPAPMGMKKGGMANFEKSGKDVEKKGVKEGSKADMAMDRKQMMGMKKGGMPMKDGKPAFMKKMNMGGMAKYAGGGNINPKGSMSGSSKAGENTKIQKKGLTEGKVIKMASGGSVSARADGIAQRGKTKFTMY